MAKSIIFSPIFSQAVDLETGKFTQEMVAFFRTLFDLLNNSDFVLSDLTNDHGGLNGLGDDDHTQYYNLTRLDLWLAGKTTTNLTEGVNLYYTQARFDTAFALKNTDGLAEGATNLYFTNERSQDAVGGILTDTATVNFTYNDVTNQITADIITTGDWLGTFDGQEGVYYLARANHTGTQLASTISDFTEASQDSVGAMVDATLTYVDGTPSLGRSAITGDISVPLGSNVSAISAGVIVDADINASAGILLSKLATLTANRALVSDGSGVISVSGVTATELGYVAGVTSAIQTQLDGKQSRPSSGRVVTASGAITHLVTDDIIVVNKTIGGATTVNLMSSPPAWQDIIIKDGKGDAGANNITLVPASGTIDGAGTYVMNTNYQCTRLKYNGTEWNVVT